MTALAPAPAPLQIQFFGPFTVCVHGRPLASLRSRKGEWLLALLVLRAGQRIDREWLAGTLWPNSREVQALANLRTTLKDLRQALGAEAWRVIAPTRRSLALDLSGANLDVLAFDAAIARGDPASLEQAVTLYRGPLLQGCTEEWAFQERQSREEAYLAALETLAAAALELGELGTAEEHLRRAVAADPLRESTQRELMRVLAGGGNYAAAAQIYRELRLRLHREVNAEPDPETTALFQRLRAVARGQAVGSPSAVCRPAASVPATSASRFPALSRLSDFPHNLPLQLTRFIGREQQLAAINELLTTHRLITLTGPGGSGKTRLALQVAADRLSSFTDGVSLVELAPVSDPALVLPAVATVFGVQEQPAQPLLAALMAFFRPKNLLLVLDNCEQVLEAAPLVLDLLAGAPQVTVLATSRAPLRLQGEQEYPVPPLEVPPLVEGSGTRAVGGLRVDGPTKTGSASPSPIPYQPSTISQYAAVALFLQQARAVKPEFELTEENAAAVVEICRRLDGLPLAIILAAARVRMFSPQMLLTRLASRLQLLTGGTRDLPARHQTLRAAIAWSYDLLTEAEQAVFRRLSVFVGGCTLTAAEAVGEGCDDVLDGVAALVDQSLLKQEEQEDGESRFGMLETIREFGLECLAESGEVELARQRHGEYFLGLAEAAEPELQGRAQGKWLARLEAEHENLRAALDWCVERGKAEAGLRLGVAMWQFWEMRGYLMEGRQRLTQLLSLPGAGAPTLPRGRALNGVGRLTHRQGDHQAARALHEESLAIFRELGHQQGIAQSLRALGTVARYQGDNDAAQALLEESLMIFRELDDQTGIAYTLYNLGNTALNQGEHQAARALFAEGLAIFRELGHHRGISHSVGVLGIVARIQGDYTAARALGEECLALGRELGDYIFNSLGSLGYVALAQGDYETARALLQEGLALSHQRGNDRDTAQALSDLGHVSREAGEHTLCAAYYRESMALRQAHDDRWAIARALEEFAGLAGRQRQWERAVRLLGAAEGVEQSLGRSRPVVIIARLAVQGECQRTVDGARAALGEAAFAAAWEAGRALPLAEAVTYAMAGSKTAPDEGD